MLSLRSSGYVLLAGLGLAAGCGSATAQGGGALGPDAARCQQTLGREGQKFKKATLTAWRRCLDDVLLGRGCDTARRDADLASAALRYTTRVAAACTPALLVDAPPAGIGFASSCDLAPGPSGPAEATCQVLPVSDAPSLVACLACWKRAATHGLLRVLYPCLGAEIPPGTALACGTPPAACPTTAPDIACVRRIAKAGIKLFLAREKALEQCLDRVRTGASGGPCPDTRAAAKIAAARRRAEAQIGRCPAVPPWWDVCPVDPVAPCDQTIATVPDLAMCVEGSGDTLADRLVCQQYPRAGLDGIGCPPPSSTTSTSLVVASTTSTSTGGSTSTSSTSSTTTVTSTTSTTTEPLPPDPSTVASPIDPTVVTTVGAATAFLYTGANPIQTGVAPGTIDPLRAAVVRGQVRATDGSVLPGVRIAILGHPEYGQTRARLDGKFDLAVNGGGPLVVTYERGGYLSAQRQVEVGWQEYALAPMVVLIPLDPQSTVIDLSAPVTIQVARGSVVSDGDGSRQATLLFSPGTQALLVGPGGSQPISSLTVRATEYTAGPNGPAAMPAELPPTSGYTYAVELSADEVAQAGADGVVFDRPVVFHLENFLGFPVGEAVPVGTYDRTRGVWVPSPDGRVIEILSIAGGMAAIDSDGDALADDPATLAALGISDAEREQLAALYAAGQRLWRVPLTHFSPSDHNWPPDLPDGVGGGGPNQPGPAPEDEGPLDDPCLEEGGSSIKCQNQSLGEELTVVGTPFRLRYESEREAGRRNVLRIPMTGAALPSPPQRIELEVRVAGQQFVRTLVPPFPLNYTEAFVWDGRDVYGRELQGAQKAYARLSYVYRPQYQQPAPGGQSFGQVSGVPGAAPVTMRSDAGLSQSWTTLVGGWHVPRVTLGGWTLSAHHTYDAGSGVLFLGDGRRRSSHDVTRVITAVAGTGIAGSGGDGGPAAQAQLAGPQGIAVGPDGSVYIADTDNHRVRRVGPDGVITTVAGTGIPGFSGDGLPATQAALDTPGGVSVGPDGSLYLAVRERIRRVAPNGLISTVAGDGVGCAVFSTFEGDGGPALLASIPFVLDVVAAADGGVFVAHGQLECESGVARVGPDGRISRLVFGAQGSFGDGGPARNAVVFEPNGLAVGRDGSLYITDNGLRVRRVGLDGIITTLAGGGLGGDGDPATSAQLGAVRGVAVGRDGSVYLAENGLFATAPRVRAVSSDGIITTVAGRGTLGSGGDNGPATQAAFQSLDAVAVGPDGSVYVADRADHRVRRIRRTFPGLALTSSLIAAETGEELYEFDSAGRHLRTLDGLTGAVRLQFGYTAAGLLATVADAHGNVTTIERDAGGTPTALVAPGGQRTGLTVGGTGLLTAVANPATETTELTYTSGGLLETVTNPRQQVSTMTYDSLGGLATDEDAAGGVQTLVRVDAGNDYTVTRTTGESRVSTYGVATLAQGGRVRVNTAPSGLATQVAVGTDGARTITRPDGQVTTLTLGPDPRFGMLQPVASEVRVTTPGGLVSTLTESRAATLSDPANPLSVTQLVTTTGFNGKTYTRTFAAGTQTVTDRTPAGRQRVQTLDAQGRVVTEQVGALAPTSFGYDGSGRLTTITRGSGPGARVYTLGYDLQNRPTAVTDPLLRTMGFAYDDADRVSVQTLPDLRQVTYAYDENGNVAAITPPGRPAHGFAYTPVDLQETYEPPAVPGTGNTTYAYNRDRQLTRISRPDGETVDFGYDTAGRPSTAIAASIGTITYGYDATTGNRTSVTTSGGPALTYAYTGPLLTSATWTGPVVGSIGRTYDNDLRVATQSVNGGQTVSLGYDNDGLVTQAGALTLDRDPQTGLVTGTTLGTVADTRTYDTFAELEEYRATVGGTERFRQQFTRDALGRITAKVETVLGVTDTYTYDYDLAGRLITVTKNAATVATYDYDSNGNRLSRTTPGGTETGTYDDQDRLLTYDGAGYTHTATGELATKTVGGQTTTYAYDALGNLRTVGLPGGPTIEYVIDGENRRVGKRVNGVLVQGFLYEDALRIVAELDGAGVVVARFVYGTRVNVPESLLKGGVTYRIVADHLGSPRLAINTATGAVAQRMDYDEFGRVTADTAAGFQPFGFAGGLYDSDAQLIRFGARDYEPRSGRWTSKDSITFAGGDSNLYGYALSDPVNAADPSGLEFILFGRQPFVFRYPGVTRPAPSQRFVPPRNACKLKPDAPLLRPVPAPPVDPLPPASPWAKFLSDLADLLDGVLGSSNAPILLQPPETI